VYQSFLWCAVSVPDASYFPPSHPAVLLAVFYAVVPMFILFNCCPLLRMSSVSPALCCFDHVWFAVPSTHQPLCCDVHYTYPVYRIWHPLRAESHQCCTVFSPVAVLIVVAVSQFICACSLYFFLPCVRHVFPPTIPSNIHCVQGVIGSVSPKSCVIYPSGVTSVPYVVSKYWRSSVVLCSLEMW
jgi:hypothetical protein